MIHIFNHYVPGRLIVLAILEGVVLALAAYVGISMDVVGAGNTISGTAYAVTSQVGVFALGMMIVMSSMGLYQADVWSDSRAFKSRLALTFLLCFAVTGLMSYLMPAHYPNPFTLGATIVIVALLGSMLVRSAFHRSNKLGLLKPRILVLGTGSRVMKLAEFAKLNPNHDVVGYVSLQPSKHYISQSNILSLGVNESLLSLVERHSIDQIVVGIRDRRGGGLPVQQLLECKMKGIKIVEMPTFFEREYRQVLLESLNPSWMVLGDGFRQGFFGSIVKRAFDLFASTVLLLLTLPILIVTAICIYMESGGPILYRQERVGLGGRTFTLYKLRSMKIDAESGGTPHWAKANDDRTTRVGRIIRKYRIDELPQIFNVLKGEMSFVGPRPERPFFVDQLSKQIPFYEMRHNAKPGITGWAQVRYPYGASVDDAIEKLQYDLYYVKNHGLFMDVMILISTVEVVLWGNGAR
ncbi:MAG TPA: TIGR03013 family XrtA/PEP-CTERM system glycosyltransferase [Burkholderiales bacterium]|nr:TIGR03013 family XrtA/PEP-CTERM system glycosyltransferase [Burkholderiales bacterium]